MERPEYEFGRQDLDFLHWWEVPTLFRCPHVPDPAECDIALVGVPHSTGKRHDLGAASLRRSCTSTRTTTPTTTSRTVRGL